jgi:phosphopantetheinyl transferase
MNVYIYDIRTPLSAAELAEIAPQRRTRAATLHNADAKARYLAGGFLMSRHINVRNEMVLRYGRFGKPERKDCFPYFNLSHSGRFVALAVSEKHELGVDIQIMRPLKADIASRCFQYNEYDWYMAGATSEERVRRFFILWVGKEAIMKATGKGFNLPPRNFSVLPAFSQEPIDLRGVKYFVDWREAGDYMFAAASRDEPDELVFFDCSINPQKVKELA